MTGDMYTYVSVTGNFLRMHTYNTSFFKVPYRITKASNRKKMTQCPGVHISLPAVNLIYSSSVEH